MAHSGLEELHNWNLYDTCLSKLFLYNFGPHLVNNRPAPKPCQVKTFQNCFKATCINFHWIIDKRNKCLFFQVKNARNWYVGLFKTYSIWEQRIYLSLVSKIINSTFGFINYQTWLFYFNENIISLFFIFSITSQYNGFFCTVDRTRVFVLVRTPIKE
jgi:hypothetical protein